MKYFFLLIPIFFSVTLLKGQGFAPLNATWHYQEHCMQPSWYPGSNCGYLQVKTVKDTVIEGANATIIKAFNRESEIAESKVILKSAEEKVYFYEDNTFHLLFDFSLNESDTLYYKIPSNSEYYYLDCALEPPNASARAKVDSVKLVTIDGQQLKRLYLSDIPVSSPDYAHVYLKHITEKTGAGFGFFGNPQGGCLGGFSGHFRCYSDDEIYYQESEEPCEHITATNSAKSKKGITIYPNPSSSLIKLNGTGNEKMKYRVYNSLGSLVQEGILNIEKEISVKALPKGSYFIKVWEKEEMFFSDSFIKL